MVSLAHGWIINLVDQASGVNYGNHKNEAELRMSTIKAIFLVVIDIEDGSSTRPLVPGHVREVPVMRLSACSNNMGSRDPLQEMKGRNHADTIVSCSRSTRDGVIVRRKQHCVRILFGGTRDFDKDVGSFKVYPSPWAG